MMQKLILQLIEVLLAFAQTQLTPGDAADTLTCIVKKAVSALETHTGQPVDPSIIKPEAPL